MLAWENCTGSADASGVASLQLWKRMDLPARDAALKVLVGDELLEGRVLAQLQKASKAAGFPDRERAPREHRVEREKNGAGDLQLVPEFDEEGLQTWSLRLSPSFLTDEAAPAELARLGSRRARCSRVLRNARNLEGLLVRSGKSWGDVVTVCYMLLEEQWLQYARAAEVRRGPRHGETEDEERTGRTRRAGKRRTKPRTQASVASSADPPHGAIAAPPSRGARAVPLQAHVWVVRTFLHVCEPTTAEFGPGRSWSLPAPRHASPVRCWLCGCAQQSAHALKMSCPGMLPPARRCSSRSPSPREAPADGQRVYCDDSSCL